MAVVHALFGEKACLRMGGRLIVCLMWYSAVVLGPGGVKTNVAGCRYTVDTAALLFLLEQRLLVCLSLVLLLWATVVAASAFGDISSIHLRSF